MNDGEVLRITNLAKEYGTVRAVDAISFVVRAGEVVGLLGPNGAGKTTTINMILGILEPTGGTVDILDKGLKEHRSETSRSVNFAAVYAHMPANLTVWQNLYVFGLLYDVRPLKDRIRALLEEFDLEDFIHVKTGLLSSGELSRLINLAKAVINEPASCSSTSPPHGYDPSISLLIREKIKAYATRVHAGILWTSHNMNEIESVCDRVLFLSHGRVLLSGNPRMLAAEHGKKDLEELFIAVAREPLRLKDG